MLPALAATLLVQGLLLLAVGSALFVVPAVATALWPWPLTPLTARVVAAWLLAFGLCAILAWRSRDLARLDVAAWAYGLLALLEVVVIIRFTGPWSGRRRRSGSTSPWPRRSSPARRTRWSGCAVRGRGNDSDPVNGLPIR
jgi:hypothetical protein